MTRILENDIHELLELAQEKTQSSSQNALCRFLPSESGYQMHHFTFRKMQKENPEQLKLLLKKYILDASQPKVLNPKPRLRHPTKKQHSLNLNSTDLKTLFKLVRETGNDELAEKLKAKLPLANIKKELHKSIRNNEIDTHLWEAYCETIIAKRKGI